MRTRPFLQLDVFADRPGAGNPLAVVIDADGLDTAAMQALAAWTNLSETAFLLPPTTPEASYRVRIFTPRQELPFAGHPSVGSAHAALEAGLATAHHGALAQECIAGLLPMRVVGAGNERRISVRAPRGQVLPWPNGAEAQLEAVLAAMPRGSAPIALIDNGPHWWCVELRQEEQVRGFDPPLAAITELCRSTGVVGLVLFARCDRPDYRLVTRVFCPADGISEDPVTGAGNAAIASWLSSHDGLRGLGARYVASQGREIGRDGRVEVEIDTAGEVWIGGQTQTVVQGTIRW